MPETTSERMLNERTSENMPERINLCQQEYQKESEKICQKEYRNNISMHARKFIRLKCNGGDLE